MANALSALKQLFPDQPIELVTVLNVYSDGTSRVQTVSGGDLTVLGDSYGVNERVLIQGGQIIAGAPSLPTDIIEV